MAKSPKKTDADDIMDAVEVTDPAADAKKPSSTAAKSAPSKPKKDSDDIDIDDRNPVWAFIMDHPWITMFIAYILLGFLVKLWSGLTIIFILVPLICFARIWMIVGNSKDDLAAEKREVVGWWAKVGLLSSLFGLAAVFILDWTGWLHIFN